MAEQNSQDSLTLTTHLASQKHSFIIKYKNAIMYTLLAIVIIIAGFPYRKYVPKEEKLRLPFWRKLFCSET